MRAYTDKKNVQKKAYYNDRFWVAPQVPKFDVAQDEVLAHVVESVKAGFDVKEAYLQLGHLVMVINAKDNRSVLKLLKEELEFDMMMEMSAVDFLAQSGEFEIFYEMLSVAKAKRIRLKCRIKENEAIESVQDMFRSANFSEREMYDMLGVKVNNHPFMKRILMPDDWEGFPLRKTYPLQGDEFAAWYEVDKIFGKEAREAIGPEIRDAAHIDRYDTTRFARLGHEVPFGANIDANEPDTSIEYQEKGGVFLIEKFDEASSKVITDRDR